MKILGLNFGHDAGVSLIVDGVFESHWEKERHVRIKHAMGLTAGEILEALAYLQTSLDELDLVAVTCTQSVPIMLFGELDIRLKNSGWPLDGSAEIATGGEAGFYESVMNSRSWYRHALAWSSGPPKREIWINEDLLGPRRLPLNARTLDELGSYRFAARGLARRMCIGLELEIAGKIIPGVYVSHHLGHAHYSYAESQVDRALIITADGAFADTFRGGGIYLAEQGSVHPVLPHGFWLGTLYETVAMALGLGPMASGKLMGMAPWGRPVYYDPELVGNWFDLPPKYTSLSAGLTNHVQVVRRLLQHWLRTAGLAGGFANPCLADVPPRREADLAASVQSMFEQAMLKVVQAADHIAGNVDFRYDAIVLGGGCALNCPANSLIYRSFNQPVVIPPAVNDEGIGAGAALALHSLLGAAGKSVGKRSVAQIAYKGKPYAVTRAEVEPWLGQMELVATDAPAPYLAQAIASGAIAGIFEQGAEMGPRALGHRSLVGSPLIAENWARLNRIKNREQWRPFAPVVLAQELDRYFDACPADNFYMLFNARVKTKALPAVTHVDGTARVQIATAENGFIYTLLHEFMAVSGYGVLINTSFNRRHEPMVETPGDALRAFAGMDFELLYLDGFLLRRK